MLICIKLIVILYNFIFWLTGVLILGLSVFLWWDSQNYLDIQEVSINYVTPFIALLILGALMTIVGFIGCSGAIRESKCLLLLYVSICLILCVLSGAFLIWTIRNGEKVRERIKLDTTKLIKRNYGTGNTNATELLVDKIQRYFTCCGVMGPEDWITSSYNNNSPDSEQQQQGLFPHMTMNQQRTYRIPRSCCQDASFDRQQQTNEQNQQNELFNTNINTFMNTDNICVQRVNSISSNEVQNLNDIQGLYTSGCMIKFEEFIKRKQFLIVLAGSGLVGVQVLALLFSFCLFCAISRQEDK